MQTVWFLEESEFQLSSLEIQVSVSSSMVKFKTRVKQVSGAISILSLLPVWKPQWIWYFLPLLMSIFIFWLSIRKLVAWNSCWSHVKWTPAMPKLQQTGTALHCWCIWCWHAVLKPSAEGWKLDMPWRSVCPVFFGVYLLRPCSDGFIGGSQEKCNSLHL